MMENVLVWGPILVPDNSAASSVHAESLKVGCEFRVLQENPAQPGDLSHKDSISGEGSEF